MGEGREHCSDEICWLSAALHGPAAASESPLELQAVLLTGWPHMLFCLGKVLVYNVHTRVIINPAPFFCPEWMTDYLQLFCPLVICVLLWLLLSWPNSSSSPLRGKAIRAGPSTLNPQGEDCQRTEKEWSESIGLGLRRWPWMEKRAV